MKHVITMSMTLLLTAVMLGFISCSPNDESFTPETELPPSEPGQSGTPENPDQPEDDDNSDNIVNHDIVVRVGGHSFSATLENTETGNAFAAMLPMTLDMTEMNGNEKYHYLSVNFPTDSYRPGTIQNGDLMLYGTNCIVLFYETFSSSYSYTKLGKINSPSELSSILGTGNVTVTFEIDKK